MNSGDHSGPGSGYISGMWCIGVYSDDGLHYCDGRFLPHCGSTTSLSLRPGRKPGPIGRLSRTHRETATSTSVYIEIRSSP